MIRVLQSPWLAALAGGVLYLATTCVVLNPSKFSGIQPPATGPFSADDDPSWKFHNPEFNQWLTQLKEERETLALKEQQLRELQTRLNAERQEILTVTQTVGQLQAEFDKGVIRFKAQEVENAKRQAKVIAAMSPEGAVSMLREMPDGEVLRILFALKNDQSATILDTMSKMGRDQAARAAALTQQMRRVLPPALNTNANAF